MGWLIQPEVETFGFLGVNWLVEGLILVGFWVDFVDFVEHYTGIGLYIKTVLGV